MKRAIGLTVGAWLLSAAALHADIIEVRGEGFLNGEVAAETDQELTLKTGDGQTRRIPKSSIIFREGEKKTGVLEGAGQKIGSAVGAVAKNLTVPTAAPAKTGAPAKSKRTDSGYGSMLAQAQSAQAKADIARARAERRLMQAEAGGADGPVGDTTDQALDKYRMTRASSKDGKHFTQI